MRSKQYCPLNRLLPYATATLFQTRSARGFFRAFFRRPKERTKESAIVYCGGKNFPQNRESLVKRNGIVTSFALFLLRQLLEIRCRLRRCTYTSQNPAIAPQTTFALQPYTILKAFASRNPCFCRGTNAIALVTCFAKRIHWRHLCGSPRVDDLCLSPYGMAVTLSGTISNAEVSSSQAPHLLG